MPPLFTPDWNEVDVCVAQIATVSGATYVIHLKSIAGTHFLPLCFGSLISRRPVLPTEFIRICKSPHILKVAAGIYSDGQRLWDNFRLNLYGAVSLGLAAVLAYPEDLNRDLPYGNEPGLPIVVKHVLNYKLGKELQMSQWNTIPLSQAAVGLIVVKDRVEVEIIPLKGSGGRILITFLDTKNLHNWRIYTGNASKAHVTNSLRADRELVTGLSPQLYTSYSLILAQVCILYLAPQSGAEDEHMGDTDNSALALGLAKNEEELREKARIQMAAYEGIAFIVHTCSAYLGIDSRVKKDTSNQESRKERARKADRKYRQKHAEHLAWKQCVLSAKVRQKIIFTYIEKHGIIQEQNTREVKAAAIEKEMAATQARRKQEREA
ncbi:hypothetical protein B0H14DRAFT_2581267 [Mycena olivaceomarginata]|nr:hypothetical protein B0H14DRAFT_2581267 [Mycena olivaceomarginata]